MEKHTSANQNLDSQFSIGEQNSILNSIINSSKDIIIFAVDKNYCYLAFNNRHKSEMLKVYNVDINIGDNILEYINIPGLQMHAKKCIDKALKGESFMDVQNQPEHNIYYEFNWNPIYMNNKIFGVTAFIRDISDKVQIESALKKSEKDFKNVFHYATVGKSITTVDGKIKANKAFCFMLGYTEEELNEISWKSLTYPEDVENDQLTIDSILAGERKSARWEKRYIHKNGKPVWVDIGTYLQRNPDNTPAYFITTIINISNRKAMEKGLMESERKYFSLFNSSVVGLFRSRIDGSGYFLVNPKLCEIYEYSETELLTQPSSYFWANPEKQEEIIEQLLSSGLISNYEMYIVSKSGKIKNCLTTFKYETGKNYYEGSVIDVSELNFPKSELLKK